MTTIDTKPDNPTANSTAAFIYHASRPDTFFECGMDGSGFASCPTNSATYARLANGPHTFRVRAIDSDNNVEANPPSYSFRWHCDHRADEADLQEGREKEEGQGQGQVRQTHRHQNSTRRHHRRHHTRPN